MYGNFVQLVKRYATVFDESLHASYQSVTPHGGPFVREPVDKATIDIPLLIGVKDKQKRVSL